ncbi:MAG: hypothetical protein M0Q49_03910 [Porticoccaceae bacterium]|nr:hypothetical protein [Porticoccaceae bacterium]
MKPGPHRLRFFRNNWPSDKGAWFPGEKVQFRQKALFEDFEDSSWMTLFLYGIKGEMPSPENAAMVEAIWSLTTSYPDPRLWNNRVASLAASTRSTGSLGIAAALAVTEAKVYGTRPVYLASRFLRETARREAAGEKLADIILPHLKKHRYLPGFGRPITSRDERIGPLMQRAEKLGAGEGEHLALMHRIMAILDGKRYRIKPNIAIYVAALLADLGYTPRQAYYIIVLAFATGMMPCYIDAGEKPEGCLFPLQCTDIRYEGHHKRRLSCA